MACVASFVRNGSICRNRSAVIRFAYSRFRATNVDGKKKANAKTSLAGHTAGAGDRDQGGRLRRWPRLDACDRSPAADHRHRPALPLFAPLAEVTPSLWCQKWIAARGPAPAALVTERPRRADTEWCRRISVKGLASAA